MKNVLAALVLAATAAEADAPGAVVIDYECQGSRMMEVTFIVQPSDKPRILNMQLDHTICLPGT
jgi:hypothetical protein